MSLLARYNQIKDTFDVVVDMAAVNANPTVQTIVEYFGRNAVVVGSRPCWEQHFGLCEQQDAAIMAPCLHTARLLNKYTATAIPKPMEGRVLFMFSSPNYTLFAFQGKVCRSPGYQLYVAQRVVREGVDAIPQASVTDRTPLLPMYRKQDVGLPLTITQHEYTSGPLAGYLGNCTNFQLFQKLLVNDRTRWDVSVVEYGVIDSERSEVFADGVKLIGSIVDGVKISDAAPPGFDDVGSAFKMLQRTGKKDATLPCEKTPASKHKVAAAVPEHVVVNPEVAHIHQLFQDLFVATNDYEADLLRELRLEMGEDDIDEELRHIGKPRLQN